jgi:hypothetical protein
MIRARSGTRVLASSLDAADETMVFDFVEELVHPHFGGDAHVVVTHLEPPGRRRCRHPEGSV